MGEMGAAKSINDLVLDVAITSFSSSIIKNLLDKPWRSHILSYQDGNVIIAGGESQNIASGARFEILKATPKNNAPSPKMFSTSATTPIGRIEVLSTFVDTPESEFSLCKMISGNIDVYVQAQDYSELYIQEVMGGK